MANSSSVLGFALLALSLLVSPALGQGAGPKPRPTQGPIGVKAEQSESADGGDTEAVDGMKARMKRNSAQPRSRAPKGHCRFEVSIKPAKLLPGQSGMAKVLMVFEGDAVLEESAKFQMDSLQTQSLLALGGMKREPAQLSSVAEAYRGRRVYDNWAIMEFPVSMSSDAPLGTRQGHTLKATFELHEGATGKSLGEFEQRLTFQCEVGMSHDPFVQALADRATAKADEEDAAAPVDAGQPGSGVSDGPRAAGQADLVAGNPAVNDGSGDVGSAVDAPAGGASGGLPVAAPSSIGFSYISLSVLLLVGVLLLFVFAKRS